MALAVPVASILDLSSALHTVDYELAIRFPPHLERSVEVEADGGWDVLLSEMVVAPRSPSKRGGNGEQ